MDPVTLSLAIGAGMKIFESGMKWLELVRNNPDMTQDELNAKWTAMQAELVSVKSAHDSLQAEGR